VKGYPEELAHCKVLQADTVTNVEEAAEIAASPISYSVHTFVVFMPDSASVFVL
jgi:hypothetical protein